MAEAGTATRATVDFTTTLSWVQSIPEDFNDATSFRHMHNKAKAKVDEIDSIAALYPAKVVEKEWNSLMADERSDNLKAMELIEAWMKKLGHASL